MNDYDDDSKDSSSGGDDHQEDRGSHFGGDREMHKTVCSDCGNECEVPFKPTEGRPIYCNECFKKHRKPRSYGGGGGSYGGGRGGSYGGGRGGSYGGGRGGRRNDY